MDIRNSQRIKQIRDNTEKLADAFSRIADALERLADRKTEPQTPTHGYMWICPKCGFEMYIDYSACHRCGWDRSKPKTEPQTDNLKVVKALKEYFGIKREPMLSEIVEDEPRTETTGSPIGDYRDGRGIYSSDCAWKKGE